MGHHLGIRKGSPESDERILNDKSGVSGLGWGGNGLNLEVHIDQTIEVQRASWDQSAAGQHANNVGKERFNWEVATQAPKVTIEGPEGEILDK